MSEVTILQIVPRLDSGGSEQSTIEIADALTRAGATALVASEGGRLAATLEQAGGELISLPLASKNPLTILSNARRLADIVEERNVKLLHARSRAPAWSAFIAARRTERPFVTTYHGSYRTQFPLKRLYNSVMARGDRVIANSRYTAEVIAARHGVPMERMRVIHRGLDIAQYAREAIAPARLARLRAAWGIEEGRPVILQAARLTRLKGHTYTIEAAQLLRDSDRLGDAVVIFAGGADGRGDYREELVRKIQKAGLVNQVRLVGHCDDMPAAFHLATVGILPSIRAETFGRPSIESQAAGCPVIVTDVGAAPENVIPASDGDAFTGWVVPLADSTALAACLAEALALSPDARAAIGQRARAHVGRHFTLQSMQRDTLSVYDELLGTGIAARLP
jgi:glycosyltransferase involved in cell wall biosynthesis